LDEISDGQEVRIGGILTNVKKIQTKSKAEIMAYCTIEDPEASIDVIVFPELFKARIPVLQKDTPLLVTGTIDKTEKGIKIVSKEISRLDAAEAKMGHRAEISISLPLPDKARLQTLKSVLAANGRGRYPLFLRIFYGGTETVIATELKMSDDSETIAKVETIAGKGAVVFQ
jgi:DNA polymerase-3 subunit alpha